MQALLRQLGDGLLLRNVDVGHLEKAALGIALAQVVKTTFSRDGASSGA